MAEPEVLGTFTNGEWRLIGVTDDEDGEAKSLREAAIESLHDELGLSGVPHSGVTHGGPPRR